MNTTTSDTVLMSVTNHPAHLPAAQKAPAYEAVRYNALKHGVLSRYTVLSHENADDYQALADALAQEHAPAGATEQHLIEELASVIWRKRRVLQAEEAAINRSLRERTAD